MSQIRFKQIGFGSGIAYDRLLEVFWRNVDPLDAGGQFCDRGGQYRTAIFAADDGQRHAAEASKLALKARFPQGIATPVLPAGPFWPAEDYHQEFRLKNPSKYKFYRLSCGRDARLAEVWGTAAGH